MTTDAPAQAPDLDRAAEVGAVIRRRREARGISLRAFAAQCELSPAHVSKIERGLASPSLVTLTRIVQELDLQGADLFGRARTPQQIATLPRLARATGAALRRGERPRRETVVRAVADLRTELGIIAEARAGRFRSARPVAGSDHPGAEWPAPPVPRAARPAATAPDLTAVAS